MLNWLAPAAAPNSPPRELRSSASDMKDFLLKLLAYPFPIRLALTKKIFKRFSLFSYTDRLLIGAVDRPNYGYCIFQAAKLAKSLEYPRISVIEFGCGGGNGLVNAEMHINEVTKIFPVDIELYGFDRGAGMPCPQDYRDMPHYFSEGIFEMDIPALQRRLKQAKLVIGDVKETLRHCSKSTIRRLSAAYSGISFFIRRPAMR
jgi:hypothetical protein